MKSHLNAPTRRLLLSLLLLLALCLFPLTVLAQETPSQGSSPESAIATDVTRIPEDATSGSTVFVTTPTPSPIDQAVANLINSVPALFVFSLLAGLCIYLIRERKELTTLLAGAVGPDMATSIIDTAVKGALSALDKVARSLPGQADDKIVENLARDAGLERVLNPDGTYGWKPIEGLPVISAQAALSNEDLFQKLAKERGLQLSTAQYPDGSTVYSLTAASAG